MEKKKIEGKGGKWVTGNIEEINEGKFRKKKSQRKGKERKKEFNT